MVRQVRDSHRIVTTTARLTAEHLEQIDAVIGRNCEQLMALTEWRKGCQTLTR
jgi:hypothetical protein